MRKTRASQLVKVAFAAYRVDPEIAKDIFCLAAEDGSAPATFGTDPKDMAKEAKEAIDSGNPIAARAILEAMETISQDYPTDEIDDEILDEEIVDEDLDEGAMSPGDEVPPPPPASLAPASLKPEAVASLVQLAGKIKRDGHPDLAAKIENLLGL